MGLHSMSCRQNKATLYQIEQILLAKINQISMIFAALRLI